MAHCEKCGGLLLVEHTLEGDPAMSHQLHMSRCLNCGRREDATTIYNRTHPQPSFLGKSKNIHAAIHNVQVLKRKTR